MSTHLPQVTTAGVVRGIMALMASTILVAPHLAHAQAVERNLPPAPTAEPQQPVELAPVASEQDDTPFGPNLRALVFLGADDSVIGEPNVVIDTTRVDRLHETGAWSRFSRFVGKPISRKLIADIQAEVALFYRSQGYPFVSVTTPEQELSTGVLQVRVMEFVAGDVNVKGVTGSEAKRIAEGLRVQQGQPINSILLSQDLEWQNRNYFRGVEAQFRSGARRGEADLDVVVHAAKPWRIYGGYTNSGSPSSGRDRIFAGAMIGRLPLDAMVSYQMTASPDFFHRDGDYFRKNPDYISHGARIALPLAPRQQIEVTLSSVDSNQAVQDFNITQKTHEASVAYRTALSNFVNAPGDILGGIEFKRQKRTVYFGEVDILSASANIYQLFAQWNYSAADRHGRTSLSLGAHVSPGGIDRHNSDAAMADISNGRVTSDNYSYFTADLTRVTSLGGGWTMVNSFSGQFTRQPLPLASQIGIGGPSLVRVYTSDDSSFDVGAHLRNEVRLPTFRARPKIKFSDFSSL